MTIEEIASAYLQAEVDAVWEDYDGYYCVIKGERPQWLNMEDLVLHAYEMGHADDYDQAMADER